MATLAQDIKELRAKRLERDTAKAIYDSLASETASLEAKVFKRMRAEEVTSMKVDGVQFVTASTVYAQVQDRQEFIRWALENDSELIESRERSGNINAKVRECLDNGEPLPPGLGTYEREYISQRAG